MGKSYDVVIVGGGIVGLSLAKRLIERKITRNILIVEKEEKIGRHSSGRNSGVLHAGLYYEPGSLKSKVCVSGAKRLKDWVIENKLPINCCGKVIVPTEEHQDKQLDELLYRGTANGATVEMWDEKQLKALIPEARTASGRAIWSPNTCVVRPLSVLETLRKQLIKKGVVFSYGETLKSAIPNQNRIVLSNGQKIDYSYLFNTAGLNSDHVAKMFGVGRDYVLMPFKGLYWKIKQECPIKIRTNLYPVPDLNVPFLGVHFTPNTDRSPVVNIGPTATPALGRENYRGFNSIEPIRTLMNLGILGSQYINNESKMRQYVNQQAFLAFKPFLISAAQRLIPEIKGNEIVLSEKVGIRSQLFNLKKRRLENDFLTIHSKSSTHVLNAISPAFTASFELADVILNDAKYNMELA